MWNTCVDDEVFALVVLEGGGGFASSEIIGDELDDGVIGWCEEEFLE